MSIKHSQTSGDSPTIRALKEDCSGDPYTIPTGVSADTYRRIPESAWLTLFHDSRMSGAGLSMYLATIRTFDRTGGNPISFPRAYFRREYGLSESTRKAGLRNLTDLGVLHIEGTSVETGLGSARQRGRTEYSLDPRYRPPRKSAATERALRSDSDF